MVLGMHVPCYTGALEKVWCQITSTNDKDIDQVEMEIVMGHDSCEVQIDLDGAGKAEKVDVAANMWQSDATEKALAMSQKEEDGTRDPLI